MSLKVTGQTMIFKSEKGTYSTSISNKKEDGTYENMKIQVNFRKGIELDNKTKINILNGFLSFWKNKDGLPYIKLVIMEFEEESQQNVAEEELELPF